LQTGLVWNTAFIGSIRGENQILPINESLCMHIDEHTDEYMMQFDKNRTEQIFSGRMQST